MRNGLPGLRASAGPRNGPAAVTVDGGRVVVVVVVVVAEPPATAPLMLPVTSALLWLPQVAVAVLPLPIMVAVLGSIR